ncbi:hypothetical protein Btru_018750 [Bulinus truncatus]|nr:hypothetical protein Btru_018750 [Bulinus truncatus]
MSPEAKGDLLFSNVFPVSILYQHCQVQTWNCLVDSRETTTSKTLQVSMNLYGCIPVSYFPSHSALTYWAQAASLAGLPTSEPPISPAGLCLKKSQLSQFNDAVQKCRSAASLRSSEDGPSSFRVTARIPTPPSDPGLGLAHHALHHGQQPQHHSSHLQLQARLQQHRQNQHHHHQQQQQQHHHNHHHHHHHHQLQQHRPFSATPPPVGNGIAPLQALCDSDVSAFTLKPSSSSAGPSAGDGKDGLKFGMSRILSDDFGKIKTEKENNFQLSNVPESCRSRPLCPCNSASCPAYARLQSPYPAGPLPSLSAVHALQPPNYPLSSSADALPGPYSILSTDGSSNGQPKRKRSWSRAVFSNLQRKGLEKRFEVQKYVTKPDRRQLAAMLGLTDAQVKVWFQNRRMKWRHAQQQGEKYKQVQQQEEEFPKQETKFKESGKSSGGDSCGSAKREVMSPKDNVTLIRPDADGDSAGIRARLSGSSSPNHDAGVCLLSPVCAAVDVCSNLPGQFDARAEEYRLLRLVEKERYRDLKMSPSPLGVRRRRRGSGHSLSSGEDDSFNDASRDERAAECDDDSRSALDVDSDDSCSEAASQTGSFFYGKQAEEDSGNFHDDVSMKDIDVDN